MKKGLLLAGFLIFFRYITIAQHFIIFFAYPSRDETSVYGESKAGHAYVSFITRNNQIKQTIVDTVVGFHPVDDPAESLKNAVKAVFRTQGHLMPESIAPADYDFVVEIKNKTEYQNCLKIISRWQAKKYSLIAEKTCVSFIKDVAKQISGLNVPDRPEDMWPKDFLLDLKKMNLKIDEAGRMNLSHVDNVQQPVTSDDKALIDEQNKKNQEQLEQARLNASKPFPGKKVFSGCKTADELGRKLILSLKTNNKDLWFNCILNESRGRTDSCFEQVKECLGEQGISDLNALTFSRVTYVRGKDMGSNYGLFKVEFNYGKDYWGVLGGLNYALIYNGQFMLHRGYIDCGVRRN